MNRDIRGSGIYQEVEAYYRAIHAPGEGLVTDAADVCVHPGGEMAAVTGTIFTDPGSAPVTRICLVAIKTGKVTILDCPANNDRLPRWSPDGKWLAFLSDHQEAGNYQLYLSSRSSPNRPKGTPLIEGFVEYLHWSPDGTKILLGVAGFGADLAGCQGGTTTDIKMRELPDWIPVVDTGDAEDRWRTLYVFDRKAGTTARISREGLNYWEANWCGNDAVVSVVSLSHAEGSWYQAYLVRHALAGGPIITVLSPREQIGLPFASPSGRQIAFVDGFCSDRLLITGRLKVADTTTGNFTTIDTAEVDITHAIWRDEQHLLFAGHRGLETVIAEYDMEGSATTVHWSGTQRTVGAWNPSVWPAPNGGAMGIAESYETAPELVHFNAAQYTVVKPFSSKASGEVSFNKGAIEQVSWRARDGLELEGWLIRPRGEGPFPFVIDIHGGPVWQCRNRWAGRLRGAKVLADHGIASLYPNPRGSSGRGQDFARMVLKDMGGEDARDILRGCDAMMERGIADPQRLGVTGISYGGFLAAWLITQDSRFHAAVPISCLSNWYSEHRTSQAPDFSDLFLEGSAYQAGGQYFDRSPALFTARVRTPTLQLASAPDQNAPPSQSLEFHRSLVEQGVESVLVTYPASGHGIRTFPEVIDATARYVGWFLEKFGMSEAGK